MKSCLLCGVGGQGTVLASRIIAQAAMEKNMFARTAETIGMAQRGGCVVSHVRIGNDIPSPLIPSGKADIILAFEPGEAVRNLHYLSEDGIMIVCNRAVNPVTAALSGEEYSGEKMLEYLKKHTNKCIIIDVAEIYDKCRSFKVINTALVGAMAATGKMDITLDDAQKAIEAKVKPQFKEINIKALRLGAMCVSGENK